jgi:hypothetical protein
MQDSYTPHVIAVSALPVLQVIEVAVFLIFFLWAVYTAIAAYHWLRYSNNTTVALSAMSVHLIVSAWLAIYAVSGLVH